MWKKIKQAWLAAELIYNGFSRGATEVTYSNKTGMEEGYPYVNWYHRNDNEWPSEMDYNRGLYDAKCPHCGFWMMPRSDFHPRRDKIAAQPSP